MAATGSEAARAAAATTSTTAASARPPGRPTAIIAGWVLAWWAPLAVFLSALGLRLYHIGELSYWLDDVVANVPNAESYVRLGYLGPDNWWTQPLKHVLLFASAAVFGDDPVGWRMRNALFGAGVVLVTYLLARAVTRRPMAVLIATITMALDPLSLAFSRNTSEDTPATFFILLTCWLFIRAVKSDRDRDWLYAGLSLGVAWSLRWYAVIPGLLMLALALVWRRREGMPGLSRVVAYLGPLPLAVYVATYLPWAGRGYSVPDWLSLNVDALRVQSSGLQGVLNVPELAGPWRWVTGWVGVAVDAYQPGGYATMMNDLPVWFLFVPAVVFLLWRGYEHRHLPALLVGGSFVLMYGFFLSAQRPILLYSSLPILPFGAIALGFAAERLLKRRSWVVAVLSAAWGAYLFPLASGMAAPEWAYGWLLARIVVER